MLCEKCTFDDVIYMPVNKVFPPDGREPLLELNTIQQCPPNITCPVVQEQVDGVPTQGVWETASVISGSREGFYAWLEKYCRTTHKESYQILEALYRVKNKLNINNHY